MSDLIQTKRGINGEYPLKSSADAGPVSGNAPQEDTGSASPVVYTEVAKVIPAPEPEKKKRRGGPGRPVTTGNAHYSKAELAARDRRQRERERDLIRDERAFERETETAEREYEQQRQRDAHRFEQERQEAEFEFTQARRELDERKKLAKPLNSLRKGVLYGTLVLALLILLSSAIFSFATIAAVGEWLQPSWPWLVWLLPVATEFFIVFGGMDTLISQARGDKRGARIGLWVMLSASLVAVVANAAHAYSEWEIAGGGAILDWRAYVGILLAGLIPVATVVAAKRAINLVFAKAE